jgi:transcription-repair coupling factor (superfamily II helicase)
LFLSSEVKKALQETGKKPLRIHKSGVGTQCQLAQALLNQGRNVALVVPDAKSLQECSALLGIFARERSERPSWDHRWLQLPAYQPSSEDLEHWTRRWATLFGLTEGTKPRGLLLPWDNLLPYWPPPSALQKEYLFLVPGEELPPDEILETVAAWGYERVSLVTRPGELSLRGDILDIYASGYPWPIRLEFFGDTLESMRLFEPMSQRSKRELSEAVLLPAAPALLRDELQMRAREKWHHLWKTGELSKLGKKSLEQRLQEGERFLRPGLFYEKTSPLSAWLAEDTVFLLAGASSIRSGLEEAHAAWSKQLSKESEEQGWPWPEGCIVQPVSRARQIWLDNPQVLFEDLPVGQRRDGLALPERRFESFQDMFWRPEDRKRPLKTLVHALQEWQRTRNQTVLAFASQQARRRFLNLLEDEEIEIRTDYDPSGKGVFAVLSDFPAGVELTWSHILVLSEKVLHPQQSGARKAGRSRDDFKGLKRFEDIQPDDLLVHREYGVGRFAGLTRLQVDDTGNDYLLLVYAGGDKLYVPVDRLNLVQKYKGPEGSAPSLDKLGSGSWRNTKERVRKALEAVAHDLVEMYAYRKVAKGYVYPPADELYREFEATFDFEETPDQEQAIREVLQDMERPEPMDRLICGDAGFGKTEVAMRAAFRAVAGGKQVALLCPTTVLAEQHYHNFKRRMEDFSVTVEMVSRFVPQSRQRKILRAAENGGVDILIGTHRLLSRDVWLPRLGLFILDEEQRFGVRHKEKLKHMRKSVDVLTLTATPIPRTLQLSVSGIRNLSVIETPPHERKAVETSLVERDPGMLREILQRELDRGGQVFWVYNRVRGLARIKEFVQSLAPDARVGMAHGQMSERHLEETMHRFMEGELDILVTTAIIESGLDFPHANTLIVDQAQQFGLSQLYQLRGRVGRSREQAYAYFVVPSLQHLSGNARKRLQTILDMDYLGAGFQVAMEDLRIRGAGNILGEAQSGNISKVGLDLFLEMLEQEVRRVQGDTRLVQETEPELNISFEANIPGDYILDSQERLHYYRAISSAGSRERLQELADEIKDRFGPLPEPTRNLLAILELKRHLAALQVERADLLSNRIILAWSEDARPIDPETLVAWVQNREERAKFLPPARLELRFEGKASICEAIREAGNELGELLRAGGEVSTEQAAER